jgi:RHS repeat-associated protein
MELVSTGAHQLSVSAAHPSGKFVTNRSVWFTNSAALETTSDVRDGEGLLTQRIWKSSGGLTNRIEQFQWDAKGRLVSVTSADTDGNGYLWWAYYDALDRRLSTYYYPTINGTTYWAEPVGDHEIHSYYDPLVEFLELGVNVDGKTEWKLYGPDANAVYGGMQGVGGLEAVSSGANAFAPVVSDVRGNVLGAVTNAAVVWNPSRPTSYGAVPGHRPTPLGHGADVVQASAWRGVWSDASGLYWRGKRYYDPVSGHWISDDPICNERDPN